MIFFPHRVIYITHVHVYKTRPFHANVSCLTTEKKEFVKNMPLFHEQRKTDFFYQTFTPSNGSAMGRYYYILGLLQTDSPSLRLINSTYFCSQLGTDLRSVLFPEDYQVRFHIYLLFHKKR